jgi:hypothetical protein
MKPKYVVRVIIISPLDKVQTKTKLKTLVCQHLGLSLFQHALTHFLP